MQTAISKNGQIAVPVEIRKRYALKTGDRLEWLDEDGGIRLVPVPANAIRALRGRGRGENLNAKLLTLRGEDKLLG